MAIRGSNVRVSPAKIKARKTSPASLRSLSEAPRPAMQAAIDKVLQDAVKAGAVPNAIAAVSKVWLNCEGLGPCQLAHSFSHYSFRVPPST